jgi:hypothetical protein
MQVNCVTAAVLSSSRDSLDEYSRLQITGLSAWGSGLGAYLAGKHVGCKTAVAALLWLAPS